MSYAILNAIFGAPLSEQQRKKAEEFYSDDYADQLVSMGYTRLYSAGGAMPLYVGVRLKEFNEGGNFTPADLARIAPTEAQKAEALAKFENVAHWFQADFKHDWFEGTTPTLQFIWSSS